MRARIKTCRRSVRRLAYAVAVMLVTF